MITINRVLLINGNLRNETFVMSSYIFLNMIEIVHSEFNTH